MSTPTGVHRRASQSHRRRPRSKVRETSDLPELCGRALRRRRVWLLFPMTSTVDDRLCRCSREPGCPMRQRARGNTAEFACAATIVDLRKDFSNEYVGCSYSAVGGLAVGV